MDRFGRYSEEENIQLKIQSPLGNYGMVIIYLVCSILIFWLYADAGLYCIPDGTRLDEIILFVFALALLFWLIKFPLFTWCAFCRTIIMNKDGCMVNLWKFHKFYRWNELTIKRLEDYNHMKYDGVRWSHTNPYKEGVFFSKKKANKKTSMLPSNYCRNKRPWSTFFVNFYPYGLREDWQEVIQYKNEINFINILKFKREYQKQRENELYPVDKELFFHYMDLWGVEIEGHQKEEG